MMNLDDARQRIVDSTGVHPLSPGECRQAIQELAAGRPVDPYLAAQMLATVAAVMLTIEPPPASPFNLTPMR